MPDGMYTARGWQPLPFSEADYDATPKKRMLPLLWGAICFVAAMACMVISGLFRREKHTTAKAAQ